MNLNDICQGNLKSQLNKNVVLGNFAKVLQKINKRKVRFMYEIQTDSKSLDDDVIVLNEYFVEGTIHPKNIERCQNGNYILRMKNVNKRKKSPLGKGNSPKQKRNSAVWRSYRLEGIDINSLMFKRDGIWKKLFVE